MLMEHGDLCQIKCKKNSLATPHVVLYPDIDEVIDARVTRNEWLPSIITSSGITVGALSNRRFTAEPVTKPFAVLSETSDSCGNLYYKCLYDDGQGWIIGSRRSYSLDRYV